MAMAGRALPRIPHSFKVCKELAQQEPGHPKKAYSAPIVLNRLQWPLMVLSTSIYHISVYICTGRLSLSRI